MKLYDYLKNPSDNMIVHDLAAARKLRLSKEILAITEEKAKEITQKILSGNLKVSDIAKEDFRFEHGFLAGLNFVLGIEEAAKKELNKRGNTL